MEGRKGSGLVTKSGRDGWRSGPYLDERGSPSDLDSNCVMYVYSTLGAGRNGDPAVPVSNAEGICTLCRCRCPDAEISFETGGC